VDYSDDNMHINNDGYELEMEDEVKKRYEEANRLLAELEVVRRRRWGES
jgi:hypothetical protein